jgi:hypothetical protein
MHPKTHRIIAEKAIELADNAFLDSYRKKIIQGAVRADHYGITVYNHFYNPFTEKGLWLFESALDKGQKKFKRAIKLYKKRKVKAAMRNLGVALHLLSDIAVPSHVIPFIHIYGTDDIEIYLLRKIKDVKISAGLAPAMKDDFRDLFDSLAKATIRMEYTGHMKTSRLRTLFFKFTGIHKAENLKELNWHARLVMKNSIEHSAGLLILFCKQVGLR